ncbi:helix-turn-helix domain-containing protein [Belliella sp. DSM 111904]|uniref:Helix-turn-helix domain-containing protein n=1 Tax=Belliella filtrata TaxID=2923435 RepID=A0ABS9UZ45_9BACT|nr:helix-turn-helix domain-containing protein [Belliella filtrata]MCH7409432.1 helix-turn-helix domain-containing protein [Belliella filtrata]
MKHISILLLNQVNLGSMENARLGLLEANEYLKSLGKAPLFDVQLIGMSEVVQLNGGKFSLKPDQTINQVKHTDLIIVPPVQFDIRSGIASNQDFIPWIRYHFCKGTEVVSLCLGAFILGSTGLLDGKKCVTHWKAADQFQKLFPNAIYQGSELITDDHGVYTGGGAFSSANLILYLIEKFINRDAAIYCSKIFQIDIGRISQSEFIIFVGQKEHGDEPIIQIQEFVERNFQEKISVDALSDKFNLVRRTLERRFKFATGNTLLEYLQKVRVEAAKRHLEKSKRTINEVMYDVGYSDTKAFRDVFKKYTGITPVAYKQKYGLVEAV